MGETVHRKPLPGTKQMKVAITGATGFLGKAVTKKLEAQKISYTTLDRKRYDLLKPKSLKNFVSGKDIIIHLAAVNRGENIELLKVNTLGTLSLLEAVAQYAPNAKIIFSSTFQVYIEESLYGLSKKFAEDLISQYIKKTGLTGIIFKISNIYGPGGRPFYNSVIATLAYLIKNNEPLKINGDGSQKRDFVYVDDVVDAITKAIRTKLKNPLEVIDICSGKEISINEVLGIIRRASGKKIKVKYNRGVKEKPWPTSGKSFDHALKLLNWKPTTPLTKGLKSVITYEKR